MNDLKSNNDWYMIKKQLSKFESTKTIPSRKVYNGMTLSGAHINGVDGEYKPARGPDERGKGRPILGLGLPTRFEQREKRPTATTRSGQPLAVLDGPHHGLGGDGAVRRRAQRGDLPQ